MCLSPRNVRVCGGVSLKRVGSSLTTLISDREVLRARNEVRLAVAMCIES